jgi:glucose/arabinose dehydrogenase
MPLMLPTPSLRTRARLLAAALTLAAVGLGAPPAGAAPAAVTATTVFSTGNQVVAAFAIARDGRVFYVGPRSGKVFVWSPRTRKVTTFAAVAGASDGFGLVLSPTFATDHFLYAYVVIGGHEKLVRLTDTAGVGTALRVLRDVGPRGSDHTGGAMTFSANGRNLFLLVGDGGSAASSQDPTVDHGKILRLTPLGAAAAGNPGFADAAIWSMGFRNSIGLAFDPQRQRLWETENGPECNDEINSISGNSNYGWGPAAACDGTVQGTNRDGTSPVLPAENLPTVVAPTGLTFCAGCGLTGAEGTMVYGRFLTHELRRVTLDGTRTNIVSDRLLFHDSSSVLAVQTSPADHRIWFADLGHAFKRLG